MKKYTKKEIKNILKLHKLWTLGIDTGVRADLSGADLSGTNLSIADLSRSDLWGADLSGANLLGANLSGSDLSDADLSGANLSRANLSRANLFGVNFDDKLLLIVHKMYNIQIKGKKWIKVGCQEHSYEKWMNFSESEIEAMASNALEFYPILKKYLIATFE